MEHQPLIIACVFFALIVIVLSWLVIVMRRLGLRLDRWFLSVIPLRKAGLYFISYYLNVATIWLLGILMLFVNGIIDWIVATIAGTLTTSITVLVALYRRGKLLEDGSALFKKQRRAKHET
jgi:hypothetical protein